MDRDDRGKNGESGEESFPDMLERTYSEPPILEPGVDGLLHISKLGGGRRIRHPGEALKEGEEVAVQADSVDLEKRRISLSLKENEAEEGHPADSEAYRQYLHEKAPPSLGTLGEIWKKKMEEKADK